MSLFACGGLPGAAFEAKGGKIADPGFFSTTTKTSCRVKNLGDKPAPATVGFRLTLPDGTTATASEYVMLNPKEERDIPHEFKEVRVRDRDGTTLECTAKLAE